MSNEAAVALWIAFSALAVLEILTLFGVRQLVARLKVRNSLGSGTGTGAVRGTRLPDMDVRVLEGGAERRDTLHHLLQGGEVLAIGSVTCPACSRLWDYFRDLGPSEALEEAHGPVYVVMSGEGAREHGEGLPFPLVLDEDGRVARTLGIQAIPSLIALDAGLRVSDDAIASSVGRFQQFAQAWRDVSRTSV